MLPCQKESASAHSDQCSHNGTYKHAVSVFLLICWQEPLVSALPIHLPRSGISALRPHGRKHTGTHTHLALTYPRGTHHVLNPPAVSTPIPVGRLYRHPTAQTHRCDTKYAVRDHHPPKPTTVNHPWQPSYLNR
eukprot:XP_001694502.1 predicted protein [Chlamydomonas reinhardtii]